MIEVTPKRPLVSVLIVDDEALMRAGLKLMIDGAEGIAVVGEAADGSEVVEAALRLDPDVILMDIRMPGLNGIEATTALRQAQVRAKVVILTAFDTDALLRDALLEGAVAFLLKDASPQEVLGAIHDAAQGRSSFSPKALSRLVGLATQPREVQPTEALSLTRSARRSEPDFAHLVTAREWEVGRLVAQGLTNSEIATALFLSPTTVKTHLASLFSKLHLTNRVQLAIRVLEHDA